MNVAEKIKSARTTKGLTQEQAAGKLLVSRQTISNWENGKSLPDIVSVIRMSEIYDLTIDELLKGDQKLMEKIEKDNQAAQREKKLFKYIWIALGIYVVLYILGLIFEGTPALDMITAAYPWVFSGFLILYEVMGPQVRT